MGAQLLSVKAGFKRSLVWSKYLTSPLNIYYFPHYKGNLLIQENVKTKDKHKKETCQSSATPLPGNALVTFFIPVFSFYSPGGNFWLWKEDWALNGGSWVPPKKSSLPLTVFL